VSALPSIPLLWEKLYGVRFNFTNFPRQHTDRPPPVTMEPIRTTTGRIGFDLSLYIDQQGDQLAMNARYKSDLFDDVTIARLLVRYRALLERMLASPDDRVADIARTLGRL
jgi:hypothetical protein